MSPKTFSYLGLAPFILLMLVSLFASSPKSTIALNIILGSMSSICLAFLAGAHWGQAVPTNNFKQYKIAIFFVLGVFASFVATFFLAKTSLPLLLYAGLFWLMYHLDRRYFPPEDIPEAYFQHRYKLTIIVSLCLVFTALV